MLIKTYLSNSSGSVQNNYFKFQDPLSGLTPNTDVDIGIVTPSKKSLGFDEVIIDVNLQNNHNPSNHIERI